MIVMFRKLSKTNKTFHLFSGEDRNIINAMNDPKINRNFNIIGFSVLFICIVCLVSAFCFIFNVMDGVNKAWSIPIGVFWGFAVTIIYILLLYTITPVLLVDRSMLKKKTNEKSENVKAKVIKRNIKFLYEWLSVSMILRLVFIALFAIIIAQPLNVLLFKSFISEDLNAFKQSYKSEMILLANTTKIEDEIKLYDDFQSKTKLYLLSKSDSLEIIEKSFALNEKILQDKNFINYINFIHVQLSKLSKKVDRKSTLQKTNLLQKLSEATVTQVANDHAFLERNTMVQIHNPDLKKSFDEYNSKVFSLVKEKEIASNHVSAVIDSNEFYIRQIIFVNQKLSVVFLINILFVLAFVYPIYLKFQVRKIQVKNGVGFYQYKEKFERNFVSRNYNKFKQKFESEFEAQYKNYYLYTLNQLKPSLDMLAKVNSNRADEIRAEITNRYIVKVTYYEKYADPPFNLIEKKKNIVELSEENFINSCESQ